MSLLSRISLPILFGLGLVVASGPGAAAAQSATTEAEAHCMPCWNLPGTIGPGGLEDAHIFGYSGGPGGIFWNWMDCHAFNACHTAFDQPQFCDDFHYVCQSGEHALEQTKKAVEIGDEALLATLVSGDGSHVRVTGEYALVVGCDRTTLIGAVRLPTALQERLAAPTNIAHSGRSGAA